MVSRHEVSNRAAIEHGNHRSAMILDTQARGPQKVAAMHDDESVLACFPHNVLTERFYSSDESGKPREQPRRLLIDQICVVEVHNGTYETVGVQRYGVPEGLKWVGERHVDTPGCDVSVAADVDRTKPDSSHMQGPDMTAESAVTTSSA